MARMEGFRRFSESHPFSYIDPSFRHLCDQVEERLRMYEEHKTAERIVKAEQELLELMLSLPPRP